MFTYANDIINKVGALISLHTEAFKQSMKKTEEFNIVDSMGKTYDQMSEMDQKKFCRDMFQKKEFFVDVYEMMMNVFENAAEMEKRDNVDDNNTVKA